VGEIRVTFASGGTVVRAEPSPTGAPQGTLPKGTNVTVLEVQQPWAKVKGVPGAGQAEITGWIRTYQAIEPAQLAATPPPPAFSASGAARVSARDVNAAGREFSDSVEKDYRAKNVNLQAAYAQVDALERDTAAMDPAESVEFMIDGAIGRPGSADYVLPGRVPAAPPPRGSQGGGGRGGGRGGPLGGLGGFLKEGAKRLGAKEEIVDIAGRFEAIANVAVRARMEQLNSNFTPDQEYYLGRAVAANAIAKYGVERNQALRKYVRRVGDAIVRTAPAGRIPPNYGGYHFEVLATDGVNGVSGPGGFVLITRGALNACHTEDEVAGLIAHELAHVTREHAERVLRASKQWQNGMQTATGLVAAATGLEDNAMLNGLVNLFTTAVGEISRTSTEHAYGSQLEYEADLEGSYILADTWYDWWAMRNLLARLGHSGHVQGGAEHASPQQRVGFLDPRLQPIGRFAPKEWVPVERRRRLDEALGRTPPVPPAGPAEPAPAAPAPAGPPPAFPPAR
jgi:Zn-dependent protease with chaperone function